MNADRGPASRVVGEAFTLGRRFGAMAGGLAPRDLAATLETIADPRSSSETIHWGRNHLYAVELDTSAGPVPAVVKQFPNRSLRARLRKRRAGSLALKSWRAAHRLLEIGVDTPEPLVWLEAGGRQGPSYYVSRRAEGVFEARYLYRAINSGREAELFPQVDLAEFLRTLGGRIRRLHEGGFQHRDLTVGNVLVRCPAPPQAPELLFVDLNRGRRVSRWTGARRARDLGRLPLFRRDLQAVFLEGYWGEPVGPARRFWYLCELHGFVGKNRLKASVRAPFRTLRSALVGRTTHAHIEPPETGAKVRERVVWDELSDQPHLHATKAGKTLTRLRDAPQHLRAAAALATSAPATWRRFRELQREEPGPFPWGVMGLAVSAPSVEAHRERLLSAIEQSGARHLLLRLTPWSERALDAEAAWAHELVASGCELAIGVPQNRELVRDPVRWRGAVERVAESFGPLASTFQIGHAINRAKWGVWNYAEYLELAEVAGELLRSSTSDPRDVTLLGPSVIDFEHHATAAVLNMRTENLRFDVTSALLYVDRRGAPENRQLGLDTVDKCRLLRAIGETSRLGSGRCWITEFNWPLREGPHSPAGADVAVDEQAQADFLVRYYLLALGSAAIERAYWWQLAARGYGLLDPRGDDLRDRPALRAFSTLQEVLGGATWLRNLEAAEPVRAILFRSRAGSELVVGWSRGAPTPYELPRPATRIVDRDGQSVDAPDALRVELGASPRYFFLAG